MYGDNMSVILNTTVPSSQLKKKHNAIAYHRVREAIAANMIRFAHIRSETNVADLLTKPLPVDGFEKLIRPILFRSTHIDTVTTAPLAPTETSPTRASPSGEVPPHTTELLLDPTVSTPVPLRVQGEVIADIVTVEDVTSVTSLVDTGTHQNDIVDTSTHQNDITSTDNDLVNTSTHQNIFDSTDDNPIPDTNETSTHENNTHQNFVNTITTLTTYHNKL
jgi:hypothetical protein